MEKQNGLRKKAINYCVRNFRRLERITDMRICGELLGEYVPSIDRDDKNGIGGTGSESTYYALLRRIFSHLQLSSTDKLMDVGCGKGRVLAFLIKQKYPCEIYGIEHNEEVGKIAARWTQRYEHAHIIFGDALQHDYNPYTVITIGRPFLPKTFEQFIMHLENILTHPITLIVWYDYQNRPFLYNRTGWKMICQGQVSRIHGIMIWQPPHGYSIWSYNP